MKVAKLLKKIASQDFSRIHLFKVKARKFLIDIHSARIVRLSEPSWNLLNDLANGKALKDFSAPEASAREVWEYIDAGNLFTHSIPYDSRLHPLPLVESAILNLTHACNLDCSYCFMKFPNVKARYGESKIRMDYKTAKASLDFLHKHSRPKMSVNFFGGEPLLEFNLLRRIIDYGDEKYPGWFQWNITTNGTLLDRSVQQFLDARKVSVIVSLDGSKPTHDRLRRYKSGQSTYDDILRNVLRMRGREAGLKVNVTYAGSTADLLKAYRNLRSHGIGTLRFEKATLPPGHPLAVGQDKRAVIRSAFDEIATRYLEELQQGKGVRIDNLCDIIYRANAGEPRRRSCDMGCGYLAVAADGRIYPCHKMIGDMRFAIGEVTGTLDLSHGEMIWNRPAETRETCASCWARTYCGGCCVADNFLHNCGNFFTPDAVSCEIARDTIEIGIWLHEELREKCQEALSRLLGWKYLSQKDKPIRNPAVQIVSSGPLILQIWDSQHELDSLAATIWAACDGIRTVETITNEIQTIYRNRNPRMIGEDVHGILTKLVAKGLAVTGGSFGSVLEQYTVYEHISRNRTLSMDFCPAGTPKG